ncbi:hypothetical protein [Streptantibioticus ferralitis]|uniref:Uncharacterized protein n=1 Tax=Streptantibioticus ferralitis TaxID=236510 RepID=A0ABT5Z1V9_9ACTN|nr:hypothetical protein [Streptantibioticus ferralitis]MDF2257679.1 hypothetical protein [Streptantibioticus ferralitis]
MNVECVMNATRLRPVHAGNVIEFETVATPEMQWAGLGRLGRPVVLHGELASVETDVACGRAYAHVTLMAEVATGDVARRIGIEAVLGAHRTVTLTGEVGFLAGWPVICTGVALTCGGLTFMPGAYRAMRDPSDLDTYGIRFRGTTYRLPDLSGV